MDNDTPITAIRAPRTRKDAIDMARRLEDAARARVAQPRIELTHWTRQMDRARVGR